jgi:putative ABC transport system permease protein
MQRGLSSFLTMLSMALGIMLVVTVLSVHGVVTSSFRNNSNLGYNIIVGAKGGQEQLVLNTVFYLSRPVENIPYHYYMEFLKQPERDLQLQNSLKRVGSDARLQSAELLRTTNPLGGLFAVTSLQTDSTLHTVEKQRDIELGRNGKYGNMCDFAIPVCLGDYLEEFRVVGTTPQMLSGEFEYDLEKHRTYTFQVGRNFEHKNAENGYFEAVLGAHVARKLKLKVGDKISPNHGSPSGHTHERKFTIVGILETSGTPNDRAVFLNIEGFYLMEDHAKPVAEEAIVGSDTTLDKATLSATDESQTQAELTADDPAPLPYEQREVTAFLVRTSNPIYGQGLQTAVNEGQYAQAVFPILVILNLFDFVVRPVQQIFLLLTFMICLVSGISILVSIYNSMSERRHEIAVIRALGASRDRVMFIVLVEAILLAVGGGFMGWVIGHAFVFALGPYIEAQTGVQMGIIHLEPTINDLAGLFSEGFTTNDDSLLNNIPAELVLIPFVLILAVLVGLWPAFSAYKTDVAKSLGK